MTDYLHVREGISVKNGIVTRVEFPINTVSSRAEECFGPLYVSNTYCNELIAGAYLAVLRHLLKAISGKENSNLSSLMQSIGAMTPDTAKAALEAYGKQMKTVGFTKGLELAAKKADEWISDPQYEEPAKSQLGDEIRSIKEPD